MAEAGKDTIYVDIDDEITSIIDKVASSKHKIVALVLPKRASVLQSIVNMKLLKRSGDTHKKKLVLITSEAGLLPLAGAVKLHVAKTLQSAPAIPAAPDVPSDELALDDDVNDDANDTSADDVDEAYDDDLSEESVSDKPLDKAKSVGELAAAKKASSAPALAAEETIELDDEPEDDAEPAKDGKKKAAGKDNKLKIPNFNKFRTKLLIGGAGLVVLLIGLYFANVVMPTARVVIKTDDINVGANLSFTASVGTKAFDAEKGVVPATEKQVKKTDTEKIAATGKKNIGEKAGGSVDLKLTDCTGSEVTVPSGTVVSNGGLNFVTQKEISFTGVPSPAGCLNNVPQVLPFTTGSVKVVAQSPGDQYNLSGGRSFTVAGFGNVTGTGSTAMTGGTTKEVTAVSEQDVEAAKLKLNDRSKQAALNELKKQFEGEKLFTLVETLAGDAPAISAVPAVGSEANEVSVTSVVNYRMLGVKRDNLKTLVNNSVKKQIDTSKQSIQDDGLGQAIFRVTTKTSPTEQILSVQSTASTGAAVDQEALKKEIAGKKKGQVQDIISARPGIKEVKVSYSPFWVYKTPSRPSKITLVFENINNAN